MKVHALLLLAFVLLISNQIFGQDLIRMEHQIQVDSGITNGGSTALGHLDKIGINDKLEEYACDCSHNAGNKLIFTVSQQSDLVYYETYYDSSYTQIKEQGYYRLIYRDNEYGYCWTKDLIWNYYDTNGLLTKKLYFNKNEIKSTPRMPQPEN